MFLIFKGTEITKIGKILLGNEEHKGNVFGGTRGHGPPPPPTPYRRGSQVTACKDFLYQFI